MRLETKTWALIPLAAAVNAAVGCLTALLHLPLYLDSLGTILAASLGGPAAGMLTALTGCLISAALNTPIWLFFLPTALLLGWMCGVLSGKGFMRTPGLAAVMGAVLGVLTAACSAPIAAYAFQGVNGSGMDLVVAAFRAAGFSTMHACFAQSLAVDPPDKLICCLLVQALLARMPLRMRTGFREDGCLENIAPAGRFKITGDDEAAGSVSAASASAPPSSGFFCPGDSFWHRTSMNTKWLLLLAAAAAACFLPWQAGTAEGAAAHAGFPAAYLPAAAVLAWFLALQAGTALPMSRALLWTMVPLAASMLLFNGLLGHKDMLLSLGSLGTLSWSACGTLSALHASLRLTLLLEASLLVLMTTRHETMLRDLESKGLPPRPAYAFLAAINFIPDMIRRTGQIREAQTARAMPQAAGTLSMLRQLLPLTVPLLLSAVEEAEYRAMALEARGFGAVPKRTWTDPPSRAGGEKFVQALLLLLTAWLAARYWFF